MALTDLTVTALQENLFQGKISATALIEQVITQADAQEGLNAYVSFDKEALRQQARQADDRLSEGVRLPLLGIPIGLKDNIDAVGLPCGNGTRLLQGTYPSRDAELVRRLRKAGALIPGKLGLHELAFGITTHNAVTGAVLNPWDTTRIPGGSSGGCGAAVAGRMLPAAIGTDTGGSVRVPAALCGVVGFRPTVGRVPADGIAPISATRDTAGPLARSVADLALLDAVLSGESTLQAANLRDLRLGVPANYFWEGLDPAMGQIAEDTLKLVRAAGVTLVPVSLPDIGALDEKVSFIVALFEFVRDMKRYLTTRDPVPDFVQMVEMIASEDVRAIALPLIQGGAIPPEAYEAALEARRRLLALYETTFTANQLHGLVFPTTPRTAAKIGEDVTVEVNGQQIPTFAAFIRNTDPGSNAAIPGITLPIGLCDGLPAGLSIDAPRGSDRHLLAIGAALEAILPPMPAPPLFKASTR